MQDEPSRFDELLYKFRWQITLLILGLIFIGAGVYVSKIIDFENHEVVVLGESDDTKVIVQIAGEVNSPGVYELENGSRVNDAINAANGLTMDADTEWIEKVMNMAEKVNDGEKIYIPSVNQSGNESDSNPGVYQSGSSVGGGEEYGLVNVNTAGTSELEELWGIGPKTAQNIIDQRPYSSVEELSERGILKSNVYERNKDYLTVH